MTTLSSAVSSSTSTSHPRLLFDAEGLASLRQRAGRGTPARIAGGVLEACKALMDAGHEQHLDFRERKSDLWRTRHGIFRVTAGMQTLAIGYAISGDTAIGDFARDLMMTIIDNGLADVRALSYGNPTAGWRHGPGHDKYNYAMGISLVYDLCHDRFAPEQCAAAVEHAKKSIELAREFKTFDWGQSTNNRGARGQMTAGLLTMAFDDRGDFVDAKIYLKEALHALEKYLFMAVDGQGAPYEGASYAGSIATTAMIALMLRRRGMADLGGNNRFHRMMDYMLYEQVPGGWTVNNLNDCSTPCGSVQPALHLMGTSRGELVPWLAQQLDFHPARTAEHAPQGLSALQFLMFWRDDQPMRTPEELGYPLSQCFRTRGVASMRTGWGKEDWLLSHFCGRQEIVCHRQGDYNHLSFYALGEKFLVDTGYGDVGKADPAKLVDRWFGLTTSHNCVVIDGAQQRGIQEAPAWAEGLVLDFQHTPGFDTALGDASACSGPNHQMADSLRRSMLVREGAAPFVAVADVNEVDGREFEAKTLWHTAEENRIELHADGFTIRGQKNDCRAFILWPEKSGMTVAQGVDHGRPQVAVTTRGAVMEMVTVFVPLRRDEEPPRFTCVRQGRGRFVVTCQKAGATTTVRLTAAVTGPVRTPVAVGVSSGKAHS